MRKFLLVSISLIFLSACTDKKITEVKTVDLKPTSYGKDLTKAQLAEEVALAGEQLVDPARFMYADLLFDIALQTDPNNKRAGFYKSFLASFMSMRGLGARIEKAIKKNGTENDLDRYQRIVKAFPNSSVKTFLLNSSGKADIKDEADVQKFLDEYQAGQNKFRTFIKNNKDLNLTLNVNLLAAGALIEDVAKYCDARYASEDLLETAENCEFLTAFQINLDRADLEILQHAQSGVQIYLTLLTAYDFSGLAELNTIAEQVETEQFRELTDKEIVDFAKSHPKLGKLRSENLLQSIVTMGVDALSGLKWAHKIKDQLCPTGEAVRGNRNRNLFRNDICLKPRIDYNGNVIATVEEDLEKAEKILQNKAIFHSKKIDGEIYNTLIRPAAPFYNPVNDLLALAPIKFDECGNSLNLADKTLAGVFPNGDAEIFIIDNNSDCLITSDEEIY